VKHCHRVVALALIMMPAAAAAQTEGHDRAIGFDIFASSDADHSDVLKLGLSYDFTHTDLEHYQGIRLETFTFAAKGTRTTTKERGYYEFADTGERWKWNGTIGTDGHSVLGSGSLYTDEAFRQEYFVSRDLVETPLGVSQKLYSTYVGAAYDVPLDDRNTVTALAGVQKFDGDNWRLHLRGRYIYVVEPDWGLSLQMRTRYFQNSSPHEYDYFSPRWYFEAIPTIQVRRFYSGWQYTVAVGWGARRDADTNWKSAALANIAIVSPNVGQGWYMKAGFTYSNMPVSAGYAYSYEQATLSVLKVF
jgi:hypothetical protein